MLRRILTWLGLLAAAMVLVLAALTGLSAVLRGQARQLPAPTGTSAVGRIELALDTGRIDPFATDGRTRELDVWIWYPAASQPSATTAPYLPAAWADAAGRAAGLLGVYAQDPNAVQTNSIEGARLAGTPQVVVLMPGLGRAIPDYTALAEDLASNGYAVVGINPTESTLVGFPDGHVVQPTAPGGIDESLVSDIDAWYADASRIIGVWADDAAFVTSTLAANPPSIGPLDFSHVAYLGHSLGGATGFERCSKDDTCVGAVDLDGTLFSAVRQTGMTPPGVILKSENGLSGEFAQRADADFAHVKAVGHVSVLSLNGSTHDNFTDDGLLYGPLYGPLGILGSIDAERAETITRDVVRAFLDEVLRGRPSALHAAVERYPELVEP